MVQEGPLLAGLVLRGCVSTISGPWGNFRAKWGANFPHGLLGPTLGADGESGPVVLSRSRADGTTVPVSVSGESASGLQGAPEVAKVRRDYR